MAKRQLLRPFGHAHGLSLAYRSTLRRPGNLRNDRDRFYDGKASFTSTRCLVCRMARCAAATSCRVQCGRRWKSRSTKQSSICGGKSALEHDRRRDRDAGRKQTGRPFTGGSVTCVGDGHNPFDFWSVVRFAIFLGLDHRAKPCGGRNVGATGASQSPCCRCSMAACIWRIDAYRTQVSNGPRPIIAPMTILRTILLATAARMANAASRRG